MLNSIKKLHFVGIGGVGMSAIAEILLSKGFHITGSDLHDAPVIHHLRSKGASIHIGHAAENILGAEALVLSSAIKDTNPEVIAAKAQNIPILHRSDCLAFLLNSSYGIAVAGAHGKTTTSSMISVLLEHSQVDPTILVGGFIDYFKSNAKLGHSKYIVAEADESDGSFLKFEPQIEVITNIEDDHMDHYGSMENIIKAFKSFLNKVKSPDGVAVLCFDNAIIRDLTIDAPCTVISYGIENEADFMAKDIRIKGAHTTFTLVVRGKECGEIQLQIPGHHNVLNALATIAVGFHLNLSLEQIQAGVHAFTGTNRRFQTKYHDDNYWIVDDYAHHPTEIQTSISAARQAREKRLIVVFQPHRYTRTQLLRDEFGTCFEGADTLILTDIYAASEAPIPGIDGNTIVEAVKESTGKNPFYIENVADIPVYLQSIIEPGDLIITMGAGNIYQAGEKLAELIKENN